jgi:hypothetical protein
VCCRCRRRGRYAADMPGLSAAVGWQVPKNDGNLDAETTASAELVLGRLRVSDRKVIKKVQDRAVRFVEATVEAAESVEWKEREDGQRWKFHHYCFAGDEPGQVKMLIQDGLAPLELRTDAGQTPLHWAVLGGHLLVVELLLDGGSDACAVDNRGLTTLHMAANKGFDQILRRLLEHGATAVIDARAHQLKETPLAMACAGGHVEAVRVLREYKADIGLWTVTAENVVDIARRYGHDHIVEMLLDDMRQADAEAFREMIRAGEEHLRLKLEERRAAYAVERALRLEHELEWLARDRAERARLAKEAELRRKEFERVARELKELHAREYAAKSREWCDMNQNRRAQVRRVVGK